MSDDYHATEPGWGSTKKNGEKTIELFLIFSASTANPERWEIQQEPTEETEKESWSLRFLLVNLPLPKEIETTTGQQESKEETENNH